ncbi:MAG: baseplate J/gp47 family protein, partial [Aeromonadaceae bacterium]
MASTIDDTGFKKQRYQELRKDIAGDWAADGLPDVTNNLQSVPARIVSQTANLQERNDSYVQAVLDAFNPYAVTGVAQDRLAPLMGKNRNKEAKSTVTITVTADANGCTIPAGSQCGDGKNRVATVADVTVAPNGSASVIAESAEYGPIEFASGTITKIETAVYGWLSVTNQDAAQPGVSRETDTQLRFRMLKSQGRASASTLGLYTAISEIDGVTYAYCDDNKKDVIDKSLQPKSYIVIADGGSDDDIANAMLSYGPAGIGTQQPAISASATMMTPYNPANRQQVPVYFYRPVDTALKVKAVIQADPKLPPDYDKQIKDELIAYMKGLEVGTKIIASRLYSPINTVSGFEINSVQVAKKAGTLANEVILQPFERPSLLAADIDIQVV